MAVTEPPYNPDIEAQMAAHTPEGWGNADEPPAEPDPLPDDVLNPVFLDADGVYRDIDGNPVDKPA